MHEFLRAHQLARRGPPDQPTVLPVGERQWCTLPAAFSAPGSAHARCAPYMNAVAPTNKRTPQIVLIPFGCSDTAFDLQSGPNARLCWRLSNARFTSVNAWSTRDDLMRIAATYSTYVLYLRINVFNSAALLRVPRLSSLRLEKLTRGCCRL